MNRRANGTAHPAVEPRRCAVYTRKSTAQGLEQEFNSLDAQREACIGYIQRQPGWKLVDERYDDGGFTGANLERPAFQRLLQDIDAGKIDVVVVYKVDRLSRSLLDFAQVMDRFNKAGAAFVSVTQNFSTADAMGRLTLNMLMSFAEFEREMIAERTRDKIAAARRKGKWTGGPVPLGYDVVDKKLVVNELEAVVVRELFSLYEQHRSAMVVARLLNKAGRTTKHHRANNGNVRAGKRWTKDAVLRALRNPVYAGLMSCGGELHESEHQVLIDRERFRRVQGTLDGQTAAKKHRGRNPDYLLRGILRCARCGAAMTPASTRKGGKEHRYYRCVTRDKNGRKACASRPLTAGAIEMFVVERLREAAAGGVLAADVERRLRARAEHRRSELLTERRDLPPVIAKLSAEGRRLVEKIGEANGAAQRLLDQRIAEVGAELGRAEQRLADVERALAAVERAEIETRWVLQALADFDAAWDILTAENRARLVRALVRSVEVDEPTGNVTVTLAELELDDIDGQCPDNADTAVVAPAGQAASEARA
jgi:DNA invertase Pin-like site-specific DNA recombinase